MSTAVDLLRAPCFIKYINCLGIDEMKTKTLGELHATGQLKTMKHDMAGAGAFMGALFGSANRVATGSSIEQEIKKLQKR
jgi:hypothetical protein